MGLRGPKPTPSAIKKARGTYRADRAALNEPQVQGRPVCPSWLNDDARKEFRRLVKLLATMGLVGRIDSNAIARYCHTWCRWRVAVQTLEKAGEVVPIKDGNGKVKMVMPSPLVSIAKGLADQLGKLEADFGMNPAARSRINVAIPAAGQAAPKARFFGGES